MSAFSWVSFATVTPLPTCSPLRLCHASHLIKSTTLFSQQLPLTLGWFLWDALLCVRMICTCLILLITCKPHEERTLGVPDILTMSLYVLTVKQSHNYMIQSHSSFSMRKRYWLLLLQVDFPIFLGADRLLRQQSFISAENIITASSSASSLLPCEWLRPFTWLHGFSLQSLRRASLSCFPCPGEGWQSPVFPTV